jgi:hypothetical protein
MGWRRRRMGSLSWSLPLDAPTPPSEAFCAPFGTQRVCMYCIPSIFTIAPDVPSEVERALEELEEEDAVGFLLWEATPAIVRAARRGAALPLLAEVPGGTEAHQKAAALVKAGPEAQIGFLLARPP